MAETIKLCEVYASLKTEEFSKVIFILDASESSAEYQEDIIDLVKKVLPQLPAEKGQALYFLGNPEPYSYHQFERQANQWFQENHGRASLVRPVWEALGPSDKSTYVIIGSGQIFDLEDWERTPLAQRLILVSMGASLKDERAIFEELMHPTVEELCRQLHDPVIGVKISGPGFMPTFWDNARYRLHVGGETIALVADKKCTDYSLTLQFFAAQDDKIETVVAHASGKQTTIPLESINPAGSAEPLVKRLTVEEGEIFRKAIHKEDFTCPHCGQWHPWNTLRCKEGSILRKSVYPTLQDCKVTGFVIFQDTDADVQFEVHSSNVLRLGFGKVAIEEGNRVFVYRFDGRSLLWKRGKALEPYHRIGESEYVVHV